MVDRLMIHDTGNTVLKATPRHKTPVTDDLLLHIGVGFAGSGRSILLSRAQVRELRDWLDAWLDHGWPGVQPVEGPTTEDVIEHYRETTTINRLRAERAEYELAERMEILAGLIPEESRPTDLDEHYRRAVDREIQLTAEREQLEELRRTVLWWVWQIEDIGPQRVTHEGLWKTLRKLADEASAQKRPKKSKRRAGRPEPAAELATEIRNETVHAGNGTRHCEGPGCDNLIRQPATGRPRRYCSTACRVAAHRSRTGQDRTASG